ncbi:DUF3854 domain-containing protein [Leptolyngbya sp. FACHB-671]|uniref:plasmid replication protein, CyRepA1 family n=1 Tax=Leptolyngbya sp. FACHB-671 TaxID=2692812 RepID=UPI0016830DE5|nr:plasmid replication protein, CyRepA1 family [Leptolyngbya sp. FACHB-671]MBD2066191.1 DUF3854 domain-containing protein [Leptolyngbya sp. FACHB-671]
MSNKGFSPVKNSNRQDLRTLQRRDVENRYRPLASGSQSELVGLPEHVLEEFRGSAVSEALTFANVKHLSGDIAALEFGLPLQPTKKSEQEVYTALSRGAWFAICAEPSYAKPDNPRMSFEPKKLKAVKYETPSGTQALPLLPIVDAETAALVFSRYNAKPLEGEPFWDTVWRCNLPIAITEGLKKALSLLSQGVPAIALRGVSCWHPKGTADKLHPQIEQFATNGRDFFIVYDQDEKPSTVKNVNLQIKKLGKQLQKRQCRVFVPSWDGAIGKGVDDALAGMEVAQRPLWIDQLLNNSPDLDVWSKGKWLLDMLKLASDSLDASTAERATSGQYLPDLPQIQKARIHVIQSGLGTGKTTRLRDWVIAAIEDGWNVLVLSPLNSLGQQTAEKWELPHIHDYDMKSREQVSLFNTDISHSHGAVLCVNSLHRVPRWFWNGDRPVLLILDEVNQVIEELVQGNTLKSRQAEILELFHEVAQAAIRSGAIAIAEAPIYQRSLEFIKDLSSCDQERFILHEATNHSWDVQICTGRASGFWSDIEEEVFDQGKKAVFVTTSKFQGRRLEKRLRQKYPHIRILRVDSDTNQKGSCSGFFRNPNEFLEAYKNEHGELPDALILSPSAKSGISIELPGFDIVIGYFCNLHPDMWMQMLARYRLPVPRKIYTQHCIPATGDEALGAADRIQKRLKFNSAFFKKLYSLDDFTSSTNEADLAKKRLIEEVWEKYYTRQAASFGAQKAASLHYLINQLKQSGHTITRCDCPIDKEMSQVLESLSQEIWQEDAIAFAECSPLQEQTVEWARRTLEASDVSTDTLNIALKVICRDEFPGIDWNDPQECYEGLFAEFGAMKRGVLLYAKMNNLESAKNAESEQAKNALTGRLNLPHKLPKGHVKAWLLSQVGIKELIDSKADYSNSSPAVKAIRKKALHYRNEIRYWLGFDIKEEQTGVHIVNKLIRRLGIKSVEVSRPGGGNSRDRLWGIPVNTFYFQMLEAASSKLSEAASTICSNVAKSPLEIMDAQQTSPIPPPSKEMQVGSRVSNGKSLGDLVILAIKGCKARVELIQGFGCKWWEELSNLTLKEAIA